MYSYIVKTIFLEYGKIYHSKSGNLKFFWTPFVKLWTTKSILDLLDYSFSTIFIGIGVFWRKGVSAFIFRFCLITNFNRYNSSVKRSLSQTRSFSMNPKREHRYNNSASQMLSCLTRSHPNTAKPWKVRDKSRSQSIHGDD